MTLPPKVLAVAVEVEIVVALPERAVPELCPDGNWVEGAVEAFTIKIYLIVIIGGSAITMKPCALQS